MHFCQGVEWRSSWSPPLERGTFAVAFRCLVSAQMTFPMVSMTQKPPLENTQGASGLPAGEPRPFYLAWLAVPILLAAIIGLRAANLPVCYKSPALVFFSDGVFSLAASLFIFWLIGRSFLARGSLGLLLLGCGVLIWGAAGMAGPAAGRGDANITVTVHNSCVWLSALFHLAGVAVSLRSHRTLRGSPWWLAASLLVSLIAVGLITVVGLADLLPPFFIQGHGGTLVRQIVLGSAVAMFVLTAALLLRGNRSPLSPFVCFYTLALLLIATGLFGLIIQSSVGSPVNWTAIAAQLLGSVYMLIAALASARESDAKEISLGQAMGEARHRYGVAIAIVLSATALRLAFLQTLEAHAVFLVFYPAVALAALYGGIRAGLLATALSAIAADYFWIKPAGRLLIQDPVELLRLAVFLVVCGMFSWIIDAMVHARQRAAVAEARQARGARALRRYELLASNSRDIILFINHGDGRILEANASAVAAYGYRRDELLTMTICDLRAPGYEQLVTEQMKTANVEGILFETMHQRKDGSVLFVEVNSREATLDGQAMQVSVIRDITERKQAEKTLRESEQQFRSLFEYATDAVFLTIPDGRVRAANPAACTMFGMSEQEICRAGRQGLVDPGDPHLATAIEERRCTGHVSALEMRFVRKNGERFIAECSSVILPGEDLKSFVILRDITSRKQSEAALQESEQRLRDMINTPVVAVGIGDAAGRITEVNDAFVRLLGYSREELLSGNLTWRDFTPPEYAELDRHCMEELERKGMFGPYEKENVRKDGTRVPVLVGVSRLAGKRDEHVAFILDIRDRKAAEARRAEVERQLLHSQKLESLGVLAGGIAHDFNNLLMVILGNLDMVMRRMPAASAALTGVEEAVQAARRAADLTRQMLAYAGKGRFVLASVDLGEVIRENTHLFEAVVAKNITWSMQLAPQLPRIEADPGQIQQVIMNLITNAAEAIGAEPGTVTFSTGMQTCEVGYLERSRLEEKPDAGEFVFVEVSDNGCGMDAATQDRIFEPFFTTKSTGRGMGMSAVLGIVRGHKGALLVDSEPGQGTTIRVLFPVQASAVTAPAAEAPDRKAPTNQVTARRTAGTVLVVDDEQPVREVCRMMVQSLGFDVVTAVDGLDALAVFREHADTIACVILDLSMPRMDGKKTLRELRQIRPDVRVLLSSGYDQQAAACQFTEDCPAAFIQKPYSFDQLEATIHEILAEPG